MQLGSKSSCSAEYKILNTNAVIFVPAAHLHSSTCPLTGNFILAAKKTATGEVVEHHEDAANSEYKIPTDIGNCGKDSSLTAGCDNTNKITLKNSCNMQKIGKKKNKYSTILFEDRTFTFSFKTFQII